MQAFAAEMNLSETAFILPESEGYRLRWFTPTREVDLCGHATLASAHALWESNALASTEPARFNTRSGRLTANREADWITLDFPMWKPTPIEVSSDLLEVLGVEATWAGVGGEYTMIVVDSPTAVREMSPDFEALSHLPPLGVIVTSRSDSPEYDFISRFFAPKAGIPEDPVTGSAHCVLAPYWGERLGRDRMVGYQVSRRGGVVGVALRGDRVAISGQAVTVCRGTLA